MTFPLNQLPPGVIKALDQGRKIEAIKQLRAQTGLGLAEAKAIVDAYLRGRPGGSSFDAAHARHPSDDTGGHVFSPPHEGEAPRWQPPPAPTPSGLAPGEVRHSNAMAWVVAFLVAVLVAYYFLGGS